MTTGRLAQDAGWLRPAPSARCPRARTLRSGPAGFTLLEILVATAVTAILVVVLMGISQSMLGSYQSIRDDSGTRRQGEAALDTMAGDFEALLSMRAHHDAEILHASTDTAGGRGFPWIRMLATPMDSDPDYRPAPRAISYRMAYHDPVDGGSGSPRYCLHRTVLDARSTFAATPSPQSGLDTFWAARETRALDDFAADGVVAKRIRIQTADGNWHELGSEPLRIVGGTLWTGTQNLGLAPVAVEITMTVLSGRGQQLLRAGVLPWDDVLQRFGRSMTRMVSLRARHPR